MRDDEFEWDDRKAASNLLKHKVSFDVARQVFADLRVVEEPDDETSEVRWKRIGMTEGGLLIVAYTERGYRIRVISAR